MELHGKQPVARSKQMRRPTGSADVRAPAMRMPAASSASTAARMLALADLHEWPLPNMQAPPATLAVSSAAFDAAALAASRACRARPCRRTWPGLVGCRCACGSTTWLSMPSRRLGRIHRNGDAGAEDRRQSGRRAARPPVPFRRACPSFGAFDG